MPQLKESYVEDVSVETFDIGNFKNTKVADVKDGLIAEIERRNDPDVNEPVALSKLDQFLSDVVFAFDRYGKSDYIKSIIEFKNVSNLDAEFLNRIFDEIRAQQATKKIRKVYGQEVFDKIYDIFGKWGTGVLFQQNVGNLLASQTRIPNHHGLF